jgi:aromatic-amino-acid transaminase
MVVRMKLLRQKLADGLAARRPDRDFGWLTAQRGMFSLLGIDEESIARLREECHVYLPPDGRMNVAGLSEAGVDYVADSVAPLIP